LRRSTKKDFIKLILLQEILNIFKLYIYLNDVGALPLVKLNEGRLLGSKATVGAEVGGLKLKPPVGADVDGCNIIHQVICMYTHTRARARTHTHTHIKM